MQTTAIAVITEGNKLLMEKRRKQETNYADVWSLPGGHQKPGELIDMTLLRELREELDIIVTRYQEIGAFSDKDPTSGDEYEHHAFFIAGWKGKIEKTNEQETLKWFNINNIDSIPKHKKVDEKIIERFREMKVKK